MNNTLKHQWQAEQDGAFAGWDFSHLDGRWNSDELPWDYGNLVKAHLKNTDALLDIGTGGGEFLLTLHHPYHLTTVTESYPPNVALCRKILSPLGITVVKTPDEHLPFADASFDVIINRHASFDIAEIDRVLKHSGCFITQQVGSKNNNELSSRLINGFVPPFERNMLGNTLRQLSEREFTVEKAEECFAKLRFFDVGAIVFYAKIIEWEFPRFSVDACFDALCDCQREIERRGHIESTQHRFIIVAKKG